MALCIRNACQNFQPHALRYLILQRCVIKRRSSPLYPSQFMKTTKPAFIQWNSNLWRKCYPDMHQSAHFHNLAEHFIYNFAFFAKLNNYKLTKRAQPVSSVDDRINLMNEYYAQNRFREEAEMQERRRRHNESD